MRYVHSSPFIQNRKTIVMKYHVHRLDIQKRDMQEILENFINRLDGEIISIIPNVKPTFQMMGATAKIDYLLIVEKVVINEH